MLLSQSIVLTGAGGVLGGADIKVQRRDHCHARATSIRSSPALENSASRGDRHPFRLPWAAGWNWRWAATTGWRHRARWALPEVKLGIHPGAGGASACRACWRGDALNMIVSGKTMSTAKCWPCHCLGRNCSTRWRPRRIAAAEMPWRLRRRWPKQAGGRAAAVGAQPADASHPNATRTSVRAQHGQGMAKNFPAPPSATPAENATKNKLTPAWPKSAKSSST